MNRMKELREANGWSMRDAAKFIGLPYTTYVNYEKSNREMNSDMLKLVAEKFGVTIDYLLGRTFNLDGLPQAEVPEEERDAHVTHFKVMSDDYILIMLIRKIQKMSEDERAALLFEIMSKTEDY